MPLAWRWMLRAVLSGTALLLGDFCDLNAAVEAESSRIPSIKQVAVMPVYWQGTFPEGHVFAQLKKNLEESFAPTARASGRFAFTNDVITADLWATPEGRREMVEEYEIDAFLNLTVSGQSDLMQWTVRLLSPDLVNYLSETERVPYAWFQAASADDIQKRLRDLVFRTLNRYPIDVFVTSIQGRYVSLSSGKEQNVFEGDELSFYDTTIKSLHPVDASWLSFNQKLLGKAKIIESKTQSSVAAITSLSYENAIKIGDGARVANIASRRTFQQVKEEQQRYIPVSKDSAIVEAVGEWKEPIKAKPAPLPPPEPVPAPGPKVASSEPEAVPATIQDLPASEAQASPQESLQAPSSTEEASEPFPIKFKDTRLMFVSENLSFSGAAKMSSEPPSYFINSVGALAVQDINEEWEGWYTLGARSGESGKGDYSGFSAQAEALRTIKLLTNRVQSLDRILVGGLLRLETIGVTGEKFGGWDGLFLAPTVHLQGSHHIAEMVQTIDYDLQLSYFVKGIGTAGVSGKKRDIDTGTGFELQAVATFRGKPEDTEFGGIVLIDRSTWSLSKGSLSRQNLGLGLAVRLKL